MLYKTYSNSSLKTNVILYRFYNTRKTRRRTVMKTNSAPDNKLNLSSKWLLLFITFFEVFFPNHENMTLGWGTFSGQNARTLLSRNLIKFS